MNVVAVLSEELGVTGIERQAITACLQFGDIVITLPVFIAGCVMWIEAEIIGAFEALLCVC